MRKIALVNQKGGCGKTTTTINLASCLAEKGRKVLLIDMDPQGHSGFGLGVDPDLIKESIYEVLLRKVSIHKAVKRVRENLDAIFSNVVLSAFEQVMAGTPKRELQLSQTVENIEKDYDYIIIDCPPSVGLLTFNALMMCDEVIIPVDPSPFSLNGLSKLLETIGLLDEKAGHKLSFRVLATNIDRRTNFSNKIVSELRTQFPENCFKTIINTCTRLRESAGQGQPINVYDKNSTAFWDYNDLSQEILNEDAEKQEEILAIASLSKTKEKTRKKGEKKVAFALTAPESAQVEIAGDFNNWKPESLCFVKSNGKSMWEKIISLKPGSYQYKFLINGAWVPDPANNKTIESSVGGLNSIVNV